MVLQASNIGNNATNTVMFLSPAELASSVAAGNMQPVAAAAAVAAASRKAAVGVEVWLVAEQKGLGAVPVMPAGKLELVWLVAVPESVEVLPFAGEHLQGRKADHCPRQQALQLTEENRSIREISTTSQLYTVPVRKVLHIQESHLVVELLLGLWVAF